MGNLSTHRRIFLDVVRPILVNGLGLSGSQALCFELGNWLRDVSQFRDPYASQLKKLEIFRERLIPGTTLLIDPLSRLLDQMFGPHDKYDRNKAIVSGAFGEWFRHMLTALGVYWFRLAPISAGDSLSESDFQS